MKDPAKRLLLIDPMREVYIGQTDVAMPIWMSDILTSPDGPVICLQEFDLKQLEDAEIRKDYEGRTEPVGWSKAEGGDYQQYLKDEETRLLKRAADMRAAITANTDKEGFLHLRMPYELWFYDLEKNDRPQRNRGITFKVIAEWKIRQDANKEHLSGMAWSGPCGVSLFLLLQNAQPCGYISYLLNNSIPHIS